MLLDSSLHLPPPVLVISSPSDVLLLETGMGPSSGEWVGAVSVPCNVDLRPPPFVDQAMSSQLDLGVDFVKTVLHSHQH